LSERAAAVTNAGQAWDLFFTDEILNIIVENTNRRVGAHRLIISTFAILFVKKIE
jgi:hypothetical protein